MVAVTLLPVVLTCGLAVGTVEITQKTEGKMLKGSLVDTGRSQIPSQMQIYFRPRVYTQLYFGMDEGRVNMERTSFKKNLCPASRHCRTAQALRTFTQSPTMRLILNCFNCDGLNLLAYGG